MTYALASTHNTPHPICADSAKGDAVRVGVVVTAGHHHVAVVDPMLKVGAEAVHVVA